MEYVYMFARETFHTRCACMFATSTGHHQQQWKSSAWIARMECFTREHVHVFREWASCTVLPRISHILYSYNKCVINHVEMFTAYYYLSNQFLLLQFCFQVLLDNIFQYIYLCLILPQSNPTSCVNILRINLNLYEHLLDISYWKVIDKAFLLTSCSYVKKIYYLTEPPVAKLIFALSK